MNDQEQLSNEPRPFREEREQDIDYRPFSIWAAIALLMALPSVLGIFHLGFLAFAVLAAAFAIFSIFKIATASKPMSGTKFAALALSVALIATFAALSLRFFKIYQETNLAAGFGQEWISMVVDDRLAEAYELTRPRNERNKLGQQPRTPPVAGSPVTDNSTSELKDFVATPFVKQLRGSGAKIEFNRLEKRQVIPDLSVSTLIFDVNDTKSSKTIPVVLQLQRVPHRRTKNFDWRVSFFMTAQE